MLTRREVHNGRLCIFLYDPYTQRWVWCGDAATVDALREVPAARAANAPRVANSKRVTVS